mgnify:FL=1
MIVRTIKFKDQVLAEGFYEVPWIQIYPPLVTLHETDKNGMIDLSHYSDKIPGIIFTFENNNLQIYPLLYAGNFIDLHLFSDHQILWESEEHLIKRVMFEILGSNGR